MVKTNSKLKINPLGGCNDAFSESSSFFSFFFPELFIGTGERNRN